MNTRRIADFFHVPWESFKTLDTDEELIGTYLKDASQELQFFRNGIPENYLDESIDLCGFSNFSDAYHRLMYNLSLLNRKSIDLISDSYDGIEKIYVSGGFARNEIFVRLLASFYSEKKVYTSLIANSSAMGAALVMHAAFSGSTSPEIELGLKQWRPFRLVPNEGIFKIN